MDVAYAQTLLTHLGRPTSHIAPIHGGWASWTFDVGGDHILRIARTPEIAASHRREERLLPELAATLDFAVPVPSAVGEYDGRTYMLYPKLPGRALTSGDDLNAVASMLRQLHAFPIDRAAALLGCRSDVDGWCAGYVDDWTWIEREVLPVLDKPLRDNVTREYEAALADLSAFTPVLIHRDLGTEHILCDPDTRRPTAIIDFETATVGDPTIDFVGLHATFGADLTSRIIAAYDAPVSETRLYFYLWMGSVHAIRYGISEGDTTIVDEGIEGLRKRITAVAR